jgi:hypothetical protein
LTVIGQTEQVMPGTDKATVFCAARAGKLKSRNNAVAISGSFMAYGFSVK